MAVDRRRPEPGLVHHSDQGSPPRLKPVLRRPVEPGQYVSLALGQPCRVPRSSFRLGHAGCAYDNAVCEAFSKTLGSELVHRRSWPAKAEAPRAVFDFIETFYNRRRRHSTLGYLSPAEYEKIATQT
jgi:putative transposase